MKKVLCLGHIAYDITLLMDEYPIENKKHRISKKVECGGGPASNAAYLLGSWGIDTAISGIIGKDEYGNRIKKEFERVHVDISNLQVSPLYETTSSYIIVNRSKETRTIISCRNEKMTMQKTNIKMKPDYILIDGEDYEMAIDVIQKNEKAISVLDAGKVNAKTVVLAKMVDYLVTSKDFAEDYTGITLNINDYPSIIKAYNRMEKDFKGRIVVTMEDKGCIYKEDGEIKLMPAYKKEVVDTTGAGDIFHGAFMYALIKGYKYEDILRIANITGGLSVTKVGGRNSIPNLNTVLRIYEKTK